MPESVLPMSVIVLHFLSSIKNEKTQYIMSQNVKKFGVSTRTHVTTYTVWPQLVTYGYSLLYLWLQLVTYGYNLSPG